MSEGLYTPNGIPWIGPSLVVPAQAVTEMRKFKKMWTAISLEECQRTCEIMVEDCDDGTDGDYVCSSCNAIVAEEIDEVDSIRYCPACGAKVVVDDE